MRGGIVEKCLIFLLQLSETRTPEDFPTTLCSIIEWGNESIVVLSCLLLLKFKPTFTAPRTMELIVELMKWLSNNLSQRTRVLPTHSWSAGFKHCPQGEQVIIVLSYWLMFVTRD